MQKNKYSRTVPMLYKDRLSLGARQWTKEIDRHTDRQDRQIDRQDTVKKRTRGQII